MFNGSVLENIQFGCLDVAEEEVINVAKPCLLRPKTSTTVRSWNNAPIR